MRETRLGNKAKDAGDKAGDDAGDRASKAGNESGDEAELASLTKREGVESLWRALPTRSWKIQRLRCGRRGWTTRQDAGD
jgi:hypothetical protein